MRDRYEQLKAAGLKLDLTRGKPSNEQLSRLAGFPGCLTEADFTSRDGTDIRNYGGPLAGLIEARELFAGILGVPAANVLAWNNGSLELMAFLMEEACFRGFGQGSWRDHGSTRAVALVPAYDRHINLTEKLGMTVLPVQITPDGSYLNELEELVSGDSRVVAVWIVPQYSNPSGHTLSLAQAKRIAGIKPAAKGMRWFIDNAYAVHHLYEPGDTLPNLFELFQQAGNEDIVYIFGSTAKICWPGAALGAVAMSDKNLTRVLGRFALRSIGANKLGQMMNVRFIERFSGGLPGLMRAHAEVLRPRFEAVLRIFDAQLSGTGLATWSKPRGGYFINLNTREGMAARVVAVCKELGVALTPAGSTWPGGIDPKDRNIRIAPSFPSLADVEQAAAVVAFAIRYTADVI